MPYIERRSEFLNRIRDVDPLTTGEGCKTVGELNYLLTSILHGFIIKHKLCYTTLNEVIGVLECAKLELYRQVASPYEDKKKLENGSVSDLDSLTLEDVR